MQSDTSGPYFRVERLHLRQWALRAVLPLAALATNGSGWIDLAGLPAWDAPLAGLASDARSAVAAACWAAGAALVATSAWLRVCAKGVLVRKTTVTTSGAYGLVRHPFYLANLIGAVGVFVVAGPLGAAIGAAWLAAAIPVYLVTVGGEESGLRREHGAAWDAYAARVPRLLPVRPSWGDGARITWTNLVTEGEPPRGLRFVASAALVAAARLGGPAATWTAAAAAVAWASSLALARASRRR